MVAPLVSMMRIFNLIALGSLCIYAAARLLRRTSAPPHTEAPDFRMADVDPDAIRDAHTRPVLLGEPLLRPVNNLP